MKKLLWISLLCTFISCSVDKEPIQRLKGYEYPFDSLANGKVFVYRNPLTGEFFYIEKTKVSESGEDFILQETYGDVQRLSSDKIKITENGLELMESYFYNYPDSLSKEFTKDKADIIVNKNLNDGLIFRGTLTEIKIKTSSNIKAELIAKEKFSHQDSIRINNKLFDVLIFESELETKARFKYLPFFSTGTTYTGQNIYAKNIGLIKYSNKSKDETSEWVLVEIRDIE